MRIVWAPQRPLGPPGACVRVFRASWGLVGCARLSGACYSAIGSSAPSGFLWLAAASTGSFGVLGTRVRSLRAFWCSAGLSRYLWAMRSVKPLGARLTLRWFVSASRGLLRRFCASGSPPWPVCAASRPFGLAGTHVGFRGLTGISLPPPRSPWRCGQFGPRRPRSCLLRPVWASLSSFEHLGTRVVPLWSPGAHLGCPKARGGSLGRPGARSGLLRFVRASHCSFGRLETHSGVP